jgi:hypothetical protein
MAEHVATETPNRWIQDPKVRNYAYKVLAAAGPVALLYGWLSAEQIAVWLGVGGTCLGTPAVTLAADNTPM